MQFEDLALIETISAKDQNSTIPIMKNEFSISFEDFFMMTEVKEMTHIFDRTMNG